MSDEQKPSQSAFELAKAIYYVDPETGYEPHDDDDLNRLARLIDERLALPELVELAQCASVMMSCICNPAKHYVCMHCIARNALKKQKAQAVTEKTAYPRP